MKKSIFPVLILFLLAGSQSHAQKENLVTVNQLVVVTMNSFNSFESQEVVKPSSIKRFTRKDGILTINMPSKSIVVLELTK